MKNLINHIKKFIILNDKQEEIILSKIRVFNPEKKEILETNNSIYKNIYFVKKGCLQLYHFNEKGNEQTIQFAIKDWWLTDYDSFNFQISSIYTVQALEKSEIIALTKTDLEFLFSTIPELERYFRLITQRAYAAALYRISLIFNYSKEERYLNFIKRFPEFAQQVPQYVIASYLGISTEYISEIRKNQSKKRS